MKRIVIDKRTGKVITDFQGNPTPGTLTRNAVRSQDGKESDYEEQEVTDEVYAQHVADFKELLRPQREAAEAMIKELEGARLWKHSIVTEVTTFTKFYPAEEYHQQYYRRNPQLGYCQVIISPKLAKFRKQFSEKLKTGVTPGRS